MLPLKQVILKCYDIIDQRETLLIGKHRELTKAWNGEGNTSWRKKIRSGIKLVISYPKPLIFVYYLVIFVSFKITIIIIIATVIIIIVSVIRSKLLLFDGRKRGRSYPKWGQYKLDNAWKKTLFFQEAFPYEREVFMKP